MKAVLRILLATLIAPITAILVWIVIGVFEYQIKWSRFENLEFVGWDQFFRGFRLALLDAYIVMAAALPFYLIMRWIGWTNRYAHVAVGVLVTWLGLISFLALMGLWDQGKPWSSFPDAFVYGIEYIFVFHPFWGVWAAACGALGGIVFWLIARPDKSAKS